MADRIRRLPALNALRAFEVASRYLNFRLAAEELGVTQGAVAQQVRGLEAALGLKLFERHARALALTEAGRSYVGNIRRAFELISDATDSLKPEPRHLTISVTPTFASRWLIPRLPEFTETHPDIDLRILATDRVSSFQTDAVDLAVRYGRPPFGPGLTADLLFEQVIVAVASPLLIEKLGPPAVPENLKRYALLTLMIYGPSFWKSPFRERPPHPVRISGSTKPRLQLRLRLPGRALPSPACSLSQTTLPPAG